MNISYLFQCNSGRTQRYAPMVDKDINEYHFELRQVSPMERSDLVLR